MVEESDIFKAASQTNDGSGQSFLDKYVGEGKKYKDVEELAKAYDNANTFIPTLKSDLDSMKDFMTAQFGELAKNANRNPSEPPANSNGDGGEPANPAPASPPKNGDGEEVDLNERIRQALEERDTEKRLQKNAQITEEAMIKHFGTKEAAVEAVRTKAQEMGVGPDWLANSAFNSPAAFFKIMDISTEAPKSNNTPGSSSDVNPQRLSDFSPSVKPGTYAHYDSLRKTDPKKYWNPETQAQMMKDAMRLGNDFYKR